MKKFYSKICIFLSITLLFFSISSVFADETTEEEPQISVYWLSGSDVMLL